MATSSDTNLSSIGVTSPNSIMSSSSTSSSGGMPLNYSTPASATTTIVTSSAGSSGGTTVTHEINTSEYLAQLIKDKNQLAAFPNVFIHLERLLDEGKSPRRQYLS